MAAYGKFEILKQLKRRKTNNLKRKQTDLEQICILAKIPRDLT